MWKQGYCVLLESQMKVNFTLAVVPPLTYQITSLSAMPTLSIQRYGYFSEPLDSDKCWNAEMRQLKISVIFW